MGLFDKFIKKTLQREELVNIIENWDQKNEKNIDKESYLSFLKNLEKKINEHSFKNDTRFITYGRREVLRQQFTDRLTGKEEYLMGKEIGAISNLAEYIYGRNFIPLTAIPDDMRANFRKLDKENSEYYKSGIICEEEKNIILDMIKELKVYLSITSNAECINYEFIPYKKIGPIFLDKTMSEEDFKPNGVKYLYENNLNHVLCRPIVIDHPDEIRTRIKRNMQINRVYFEYNNHKIEITCSFIKFINYLKEICNDLIITKKIENLDGKPIEWQNASSEKLGITLSAQKIENNYYIQTLIFNGKESFKKSLDMFNNDEIYNGIKEKNI